MLQIPRTRILLLLEEGNHGAKDGATGDPQGCNIIFGQTHFIKTVEDLYEIMMGTIPNANSESDSVRPPAIASSGEKETTRP